MTPRRLCSIAATALLIALPIEVAAQTISDWVVTGAAPYLSDSSWQVDGQPLGAAGSAPDTPSEIARLALPTAFTAQLAPGTSTTVSAIEVSGGAFATLAFDAASPGSGDALLAATGELLVDDAELTLTDTGGAIGEQLTLSTDVLRVRGGGRLIAQDTTAVNATQTIILAEEATSSLRIVSPRQHTLGEVSIGEAESNRQSVFEAELSVTNQAVVETGALSLAATGPGNLGVVNVFSATLQQTGAATLSIGADEATGSASFLLDSDSELRTATGGVTIRRTGQLQNLGGSITFGGDLTIAGGRLVESSGATRNFADSSQINLTDGGSLQLSNAELALLGTQTLSLSGPGSELTGDGDLTLGSATTLDIELASLTETVAPIRFDGEVDLQAAISLRFAEGLTPGLGTVAPLVEADRFTLSPTSVQAPELPAGLTWELETVANVLQLVVIESQLPGDFNGDEIVSAADFVIVRDTANTPQAIGNFEEWRQHFGAGVAPATSPATALATKVPEPNTLALLAATFHLAFRRRQAGLLA